ncbi:MAG: NADPH:quinone oxidoreductase family protein [Pseudomonadota bacterium]|jgi:NADPH2:quinone reductase
MKAVVCKQFGPPETLTIEELPSPKPAAGQVVVSVKAASLNFPDTLIIQDKYQMKPSLPFTPGSEMAGVVKEVGEGVTRLKPGDPVLGVIGYGAFAQECVAAAERLVPIPAGMDFNTAAAFLMTYGTSHHALRHRAASRPGETLLVLGAAGGVGLAAVEIGKVLGLRVIACASSDDKLALCRQHGADEGINYSREDLRARIKELTVGQGVDVIYDAVGGAYTEPALRSSTWRARLLVIGFAAGDIPRIPLNLPLLMERDIIGVHWGAWIGRAPEEFQAAVAELGAWFRKGRIRPHVSQVYPLTQVSEAMHAMLQRRVTGKAVIAIPD